VRLVVADTSPLRALANLGLLSILRDLYSEVIVPPAVAAELRGAPDGQASVEPEQLTFLRVLPLKDHARADEFLRDLDLGESEALALAIEIGATLVLIDESKGRAKATALGLDIVGVIGILLQAKERGRIASLLPLLDRLQNEFDFWLSPRIRISALHLAGEAAGGDK
jgi:uncharacterized protein